MTVKPEEVGLSSPRLARIGEHWQRYIDAGKLAGTLTLIARRGKVAYCEALGHLEIERRRPVTRRLGLAHLLDDQADHERGADDALRAGALPARRSGAQVHPVVEGSRASSSAATIPSFATAPPARPMTVRDLLSHTSGLTYGFMERTQRGRRVPQAGRGGPRQARLHARRHDATARPSCRWSSRRARAGTTRVSTDVVGHLDRGHLRAAARRLPRRARLRAAGHARHRLRHPRRPGAALRRQLRAAGRRHGCKVIDDPAREPVPRRPSFLSGGGGLVSTARDYHRFTDMLLNRGELDGVRLLGRKTVELMTTNHLPGGRPRRSSAAPGSFTETPYAGVGFGLGFSVMQSPARAHRVSARPASTRGAARPARRSGSTPRRTRSSIFMTQLMPSSSYPLTPRAARAELRVADRLIAGRCRPGRLVSARRVGGQQR